MTMRMKLIIIALALLVGGGLAFYHLHGHGHGAEGGLQLNAGQKWQTDQPLREGMERIRGLVIVASPTGSASDMEALANGIQQQVDYLIANCKLAPAADEALHVMIADLLEGAVAPAVHVETGGGPEGHLQHYRNGRDEQNTAQVQPGEGHLVAQVGREEHGR